MGLSINQNIAAVNSYRNLSNTQNDLSKSLEKLSSGFRINRAADDAAGLAISEGLRSQVGGLKVAARNAQDGISVVQTAEGALTEVHSILQRVRDLGVQAGNDSNNDKARANIKTESDSLVAELGRIAKSTNFNGTKLLDGSTGTLKFQVGADGNADSQIAVDLSTANVSSVQTALTNAAIGGGTTFALAATPSYANGTFNFTVDNGGVDTNISVTTSGTAATSAQELADKLNSTAGFQGNLTASVVKNTDGVSTGIVVRSVAGGTVHGGAVGAYAEPNAAVFAAGDGSTAAPSAGLDFSSASAAQASIGLIDQQIEKVSTARANLGAMQNRFEHTIKNVNVAVENLSASESRIRDTDMASEMVSFTRAQILSQAGTAMLAQANQIPQGVLSLLR